MTCTRACLELRGSQCKSVDDRLPVQQRRLPPDGGRGFLFDMKSMRCT